MGRQGQSLLLREASHGSLQAYLDKQDSPLDIDHAWRWCRQATEAIAYIHGHGVIHSDLRPDNFLIHESAPGTLDVLLCDFGGATCSELGLDGNQLPDGPFYDPLQGTKSTPALDIFSLGSVLYTILTGHWPFRSEKGPFQSTEEMLDYETQIQNLHRVGKYADITGLKGGQIILGCWERRFENASDVLIALDAESPMQKK